MWTHRGNSDGDFNFEQEDNAEVTGTMRGREPGSDPETKPPRSTKGPSRSELNIPQCSNQGSNAVPRSSSESQASFNVRPQNRSTSAPEVPGSKIPPSFERYRQDVLLTTEIEIKVLNLLQKSLKDEDATQGYVYALSMEEYPGYIKIGCTRDSIENRRKDIGKCVPYPLQVYNKNDFLLVPNHRRVEKLIHEELRNERQKFACSCRTKPDGTCSEHDEWFAISKTKASEVVDKWRKWMSVDPYTEGELKPTEQLKLNYYKSCADLVQWTDFVEVSRWKLMWTWLHSPRKSNCSPWDSLCKYWKTNLIFCFATYMFSYALLFILFVLPSAFISIRYLAGTNTMFLIGSAILYAA